MSDRAADLDTHAFWRIYNVDHVPAGAHTDSSPGEEQFSAMAVQALVNTLGADDLLAIAKRHRELYRLYTEAAIRLQAEGNR